MQKPQEDRTSQTSRRSFLRGLAWGTGAAAFAGRVTRAAASPEWEQTVAAAKKEGKVAINTFTGQGYGRVLKLFAQAYPEIKVDHTNLEPVDFSPRVINERKAGVYTWDVATMPTTTALQVLKPAGVWDPVRPAIIAPDARSDANWRGGFEAGFLDKDKRLAYAFTLVRAVGVRHQLSTDTDTNSNGRVDPGETFTDVNDKRAKLKWGVQDVDSALAGDQTVAIMVTRDGADHDLGDLLRRQHPVRGGRRRLERVVRLGRRPAARAREPGGDHPSGRGQGRHQHDHAHCQERGRHDHGHRHVRGHRGRRQPA